VDDEGGFGELPPGIPVAMTTSITPYEDGPLIVRGDFVLRTPDGESIDSGRGTVALCRCGRSALKPFCDGTHKAANFHAGSDRDSPAPRAAADSTGLVHPEKPK
jgi:CDGSH-type Zn-finger protein